MSSVGCVDDANVPEGAFSENSDEILFISKTISQIESSLIKNSVEKYGFSAVKRALGAYKKVKTMKPNYLPSKDLLKIILYIENDFQKAISENTHYQSRKKTGLICPIEYDPKSGDTYIHLAPFKESQLGAGCHKRVSISIKYDRKFPHLVANNVFKGDSEQQEIDALTRLHGDAGLLETLAFTKRKKTHGKTILGFVTKLYNLGPLGRSIKNKRSFTKKEIVSIGCDLLTGLKNLHSKGYCHRDLHDHNIVLDESYDAKKRKISAVFIDFGRAQQATEIGDNFPQASKRMNPPEFYKSGRKDEDHRLSDIYALGFNLYTLINKKMPPWGIELFNAFKTVPKLKVHERIQFGKKLTSQIDQYVIPKLKKFANANKKSKIEPFKQFKMIVLEMLSSDPKNRPHAEKLLIKAQSILKKM